MTDVVSNLELRFGGPSTEDRFNLINRRAIEFNVSVERILIDDFEDLFTNVWMRKDRENIFELLMLVIAGEKVYCKDVSYGTYHHNGNIFPKVVIHGDYLNIKESPRRIWINDEIANAIGNELDLNFEYEFVEFLRIKR